MTTVEIPDAARQHAPTTAPALVAGEVWRTLSGPFMCTGCGGRFILCPDAMQTVDGARKLCRVCNTARLDDFWDAQPAGFYGVGVNGQYAGAVWHEPTAPHAYDREHGRPRGAERCAYCHRPASARVHQGDPGPLTAVTTGDLEPSATVPGTLERPVYALDGAQVGALRYDADADEWRAQRAGYRAPRRAYHTRGHALAAVGWLDTVAAGRLAVTLTTTGAAVVLACGSVVDVLDASAHDAPAGHIVLTVRATRERLELVGGAAVDTRADVDAGHSITYRLTFRAGDLLPLTPPCDACGVDAGEPCAPNCASTAHD
jgi:hypothetical protein